MSLDTKEAGPEGPTSDALFQSNFATSNSSNDTDDLAADLALRGRMARVAIRHRWDQRRASWELDQLVPRPRAVYTPCTFGLEEHELRAEARRLYAAGWGVADIVSVLAVEPDVRTRPA